MILNIEDKRRNRSKIKKMIKSCWESFFPSKWRSRSHQVSDISDVEFVELLLHCRSLNMENETSHLYSSIVPYIDQIFEGHEYIEIDDERVYRTNFSKIVEYIFEFKIIIRNRLFQAMFEVISAFHKKECARQEFVKEIKELNLKQMIANIDSSYVLQYKNGFQPISIELTSCGMPPFDIYNYLMTFQRDRTRLVIEKRESDHSIFLHYQHESGRIYKYNIVNPDETLLYVKYRPQSGKKKNVFLEYSYYSALREFNNYPWIIKPIYLEESYFMNLLKCKFESESESESDHMDLRSIYKNYTFRFVSYIHNPSTKKMLTFLVME